jgi:hypothetical protein
MFPILYLFAAVLLYEAVAFVTRIEWPEGEEERYIDARKHRVRQLGRKGDEEV